MPYFRTYRKARLAYMVFNKSPVRCLILPCEFNCIWHSEFVPQQAQALISRSEMAEVVRNIFEERWNLAKSLRGRHSYLTMLSSFVSQSMTFYSFLVFERSW